MRRVSWVAAAAALALAACGGGGGGGGGTTPPPPAQSLVFTPAGQPTAKTIYLDAAATSTVDRLVLEVRANEADDLFGVSFDLVFPDGLLDWDRDAVAEGDFLGADGVDTSLIAERDGPGRLLLAYSRLGDDAGGVSGSGLLFTLEFRTAASGQSALTIELPFVVDGTGGRRFDYTWLAGTLSIVK